MQPLRLDHLDDDDTPGDPQEVLGTVSLSGSAAADLAVGLGATRGLREVWRVPGAAVRRGTEADLRFAATGELCFGTLRRAIGPAGAAAAAESAYRAIFALIEREGCPNLLRVSNYIPAITGPDLIAGVPRGERYRAFNEGRARAFHARGRAAPQAPAACGLGCEGEALVLFFLAGRAPGRNLENPRQVSAFDYPERYGRVPPLFARATIAAGHLFISGTASIVGHESRHAGNVAAQTGETMRNLSAVLDAAGGAVRAPDLRLKVYLRRLEDQALVERLLAQTGFAPPLGVLRADICRPELDVEIEAHAPWP